MRRTILYAAIWLCVAPGRAIADFTCTPTKPLAQQNRTHMKHRKQPAADPGVTLVTVAQLIAEPSAAGISEMGFKRKDSPLDPRESQEVILKGELWLVNVEENDCDFHLEITGLGGASTDDRIIVEIPQGTRFRTARNALIQALGAHGVTLKRHTPLTTPLRVQVLGFLFYDAWHFSSTDPQRGNGHGSTQVATLWEVHPVFAIIFPESP
jgi:hypothetical protein